jgi:predicted peptidase
VLIELGVTDKNAATFIQQGRQAVIKEASVSVRQLENIKTADGENNYKPTGDAVTSDTQINLVVDNFKQLEYKDAATGKKLSYNLFTPENYDPTKRYPLVLFIHDAGATGTNTKTTLVQGLGAVVWATPSEQAKHACFVLAPQYSNAIVNDQSEITEEGDITVRLLKSITSQYSIDTNRLYATGQSMGCMASIALNIQYPDLFAASLLVAGQWDAAKVAPMAKDKLWIIVSEGDLKAFPGMNAITAALEKDGAKVSRATWSGKSTAAEFATAVSTMIAQGNNIHYTVLKKGTVVPAGMTDDGGSNHICIWWIAYNIEGVRDWLFMQAKK